jgi:hypothetical protein
MPVTANVTVEASPDAGLATLKAFLAGTKTSLVVGMYDFTSAENPRRVRAEPLGAGRQAADA